MTIINDMDWVLISIIKIKHVAAGSICSKATKANDKLVKLNLSVTLQIKRGSAWLHQPNACKKRPGLMPCWHHLFILLLHLKKKWCFYCFPFSFLVLSIPNDSQCASALVVCGYLLVMAGSSLPRLINPTLHIHSGLANLKSTFTRNPQLGPMQVKMTIVSSTRTCTTSLQHLPVNLPGNNCQFYRTLTELRNSCHHKPFPQGSDAAKLCSCIRTSYVAGHIPRSTKGTVRGHKLHGWDECHHSY